VLKSKCLRFVTGAPWYVNNRQIDEDLVVPLFADHFRALTASFDSNLPLVRQLGRYLRWPRAVPVARENRECFDRKWSGNWSAGHRRENSLRHS